MQLTVRSNIEAFQRKVAIRNRLYEDTKIVFSNEMPYARWIEKGGTKRYIISPTSKSRRKLGLTHLPKGGTTYRTKLRTVLKQPAYRMVDGVKIVFRNLIRSYFVRHKPYSNNAIVQARDYIGKTGVALFRVRTPRKGPLYKAWRYD